MESLEKSLVQASFEVVKENNALVVNRNSNFSFELQESTEESVPEKVLLLARKQNIYEELKYCNYSLEITVSNFERAIDEINCMIDIQILLQETTNGFLFLPWSEDLSKPENIQITHDETEVKLIKCVSCSVKILDVKKEKFGSRCNACFKKETYVNEEGKVPCVRCMTNILEVTAKFNEGLCMRCKRDTHLCIDCGSEIWPPGEIGSCSACKVIKGRLE